MADPFRYFRRVEFCETDAAGIAHFSAFYLYMEQAEHALLRSLGTSVMYGEGGVKMSWPRVAASCEFHGAAHFEDVLEVEVTVTRIGTTSVGYRFRFRCGDRKIAQGQMTAVHCRIPVGAAPEPTAIPASLREQLATFLEGPDTAKETGLA